MDSDLESLLDRNRLIGKVPAYESHHMRHFLTDWEQYEKNQPEPREEYQLRKNLVSHVQQ